MLNYIPTFILTAATFGGAVTNSYISSAPTVTNLLYGVEVYSYNPYLVTTFEANCPVDDPNGLPASSVTNTGDFGLVDSLGASHWISIGTSPSVTDYLGYTGGTNTDSLRYKMYTNVMHATADANANNSLFYSADFKRNPNCIATNWYGWSAFLSQRFPGNEFGWSAHLISPHCAISSKHVGIPAAGTKMVAEGEDGNFYTNSIAAGYFYSGSDLTFLVFSNAFPSPVVPLWVFPPDVTSYFDATNFLSVAGTRLAGMPMLWVRNNNGPYLEVKAVSGIEYGDPVFPTTTNLEASSKLYNCPAISDSIGTSGDSTGPFYIPFGTNLVMGFSLTTASLSGPFVSDPQFFSWVSNKVVGAGDSLKVVDLSGYPKY